MNIESRVIRKCMVGRKCGEQEVFGGEELWWVGALVNVAAILLRMVVS